MVSEMMISHVFNRKSGIPSDEPPSPGASEGKTGVIVGFSILSIVLIGVGGYTVYYYYLIKK